MKVQTAQLQKVDESTEYLASIRSRGASVLQPEVEGQITRIFARSGQRVKAGEPLLEIDPQKQQATVHSEEASQRARLAALKFNQDELERRKKLFAAGVISRQELDQAQTAYDASKADVDALDASVRQQRVQLRYFTVNAPTSGTVGDIPVRIGDRVTNSTILTTIDTGGGLEAYISIPAENAQQVRLGSTVQLLDESGKPAARVPVTFVSPRVDPETQLLLVKAALPDGNGLRNDQLVHARVVWREAEHFLVPVTAVSRMGGQVFAFVAQPEGGKTFARQRVLKVGEIAGDNYIVLDGLKPGDQVIVSGVQMLAEGMPVQPQS